MINLWQTFNETLVELFIGISDKGREHSKLIEDREKTTLHQRLKENRHSHSTHRPSPLQPLSIPPPSPPPFGGQSLSFGPAQEPLHFAGEFMIRFCFLSQFDGIGDSVPAATDPDDNFP